MSSSDFTTVEDISAYVTHSINTPLTYVKGNLEIITSDIEEMPASKHKNELLKSTKKMLQGIKEIQKVVNVVHAVTKDSLAKK